MDNNPNSIHDQEQKSIKRKNPPCRIRRSRNRLIQFNKTKKLEILNKWINEGTSTKIYNFLIIKNGYVDMQHEEQIVMHYINPDLTTFPRGFAQFVALTHDEYEIEKLEHYNITQENDKELNI